MGQDPEDHLAAPLDPEFRTRHQHRRELRPHRRARQHALRPPGHGAAYVYRFDGKQWVPHGPVLLPPQVNDPKFGFSVGLSGTTGIVGAYGENNQRGAAYIYHIDPPMGDLNCDGLVNGLDLGILLSQWSIAGAGGGSADFNADDLVNGLDLGILLANWSLP
jgi:hypothetical protein